MINKTCSNCVYGRKKQNEYPCSVCCRNYLDMYIGMDCGKCIHKEVCKLSRGSDMDCKHFIPEEDFRDYEDD